MSRKKLTIEEMHVLAVEKGGECLSTEYVNSITKLKWRCSKGHEWEARPGDIKRVSWCPNCSRGGSSLGEKISRELLESMLGFPLIKSRPNFLNGLELDGYNEEQKIAFEYHGDQHYKPVQYWGGHEALKSQKERDAKKETLCRNAGINLIIIPQFKNVYDLSGCIDQIDYCVLFRGLKRKPGWRRPKKLRFLDDPLSKIFGESYMKELINVVESKGGKILTSSVMSSNEKLKFECSCGNVWDALARDIRSGHWCMSCSGHTKKTVSYGKELAKKINAEFISKEFLGMNKRHEWKCQCGNKWIAKPLDIRGGTKCPKCFGNNIVTIEKLREFARLKGGDCISKTYVDTKSPVRWVCEKNHEWMATANNITRPNGTWCPKCQKEKITYTINNAKKLAESKGGKFLSKEFTNTKALYWWECSCSHRWLATYASIRGKSWCPPCGNKRKGKPKNKVSVKPMSMEEKESWFQSLLCDKSK